MTIEIGTHITLEVGQSTFQATVSDTGAPLGAADEMAIFIDNGITADLELAQSIVGTWRALIRKALNRLSTMPAPEAAQDYVVLSGPIGVTDADIVVGGVPDAATLRLHVGIDFIDGSKSHFIDTLSSMLVNRWLELSK